MEKIRTIPKSESDLLLKSWGYDLIDDYFQMITEAGFPHNNIILDVATGTGRAASVLSRLDFQVLTGDYSLDKKIEAETRITEEYLCEVEFLKLNLENIPFEDNSIENIVCINTLHELENPLLSISEIIRIHSTKGILLVADFNSEGFDVLDKLHTTQFGKLHPRGKISLNELENILKNKYSVIKKVETQLNTAYIVQKKRS
ncbi:MAG: class I SAM-dependent methyltransferase [Ignavibacteriales bacterium]|nr:class I SAM-dependent methyltransferase [Ignavibacteriales bacterium]